VDTGKRLSEGIFPPRALNSLQICQEFLRLTRRKFASAPIPSYALEQTSLSWDEKKKRKESCNAMNTIDLSAKFSISAEKLYRAWLDPVHHAAMSYGGEAEFDPRVGGQYSSGDGYITGEFLELVPGKKLVQTWRTTEFADDQPDSTLELTFTDSSDGCTFHLAHSGLPDDQIESYEGGWHEFYLDPMKLYFGG